MTLSELTQKIINYGDTFGFMPDSFYLDAEDYEELYKELHRFTDNNLTIYAMPGYLKVDISDIVKYRKVVRIFPNLNAITILR